MIDDEIISKALQIEKKKRQKLYSQLAKEFAKEKELVSEPSKAHTQAPQLNQFDIVNITTNSGKNQDQERYTLSQIQQLFDYDTMIQETPSQLQDIDSVMNILDTAMNTNKSTIRVAGENKPAMAVIGKLMKLDKELIMYAVGKFSEQTGRIKNPAAYILTILFHAREQYYLEMKNKAAHGNAPEKTDISNKTYTSKNTNGVYNSFLQRSYDYDALEKELLEKQEGETDREAPQNDMELQEQLSRLFK